MQHSQKKPFKNFYSKSKGYGSENYDYTSSETSSSYYSSNYYKSNSNYRYPKSKRHYTEYSTYHPTTEQYVPIDKTNTQTEEKYVKTPRGQAHQDKWQHDKFVDDSQSTHPSDQARPNSRRDQKNKNRGEKRPDRQLYSARNKHVHGENDSHSESFCTDAAENIHNRDDHDLGSEFQNNQPGSDKKDQILQATNVKGILGIGEDKEGQEDKSFVSNVSTAMSDKLKNGEDEMVTREKSHSNDSNLRSFEPKTLFEISLKSERGREIIRIYDEEEDYEQVVERICRSHNLTGRTSLFFKINLLKLIFDSTKNKKRVEPCLDRLLELNAKIILYETGRGPADESIKAYLEPTPEMNPRIMLPLPVGLPIYNMNRRTGEMMQNSVYNA